MIPSVGGMTRAMGIHKENNLKIFRSSDQTITHSEIIPMRLDTESVDSLPAIIRGAEIIPDDYKD